MQDDKVIDHLGGGAAVAKALQERFPKRKPVGKHAVYMWKKRGVPDAWRYAIAELALAKPLANFDARAFINRDTPKGRTRRASKAAA